MALTISGIKMIVVGDRRSNQATLAINTTSTNAMTPEEVGMHKIEGVKFINPSNPLHVSDVIYDGTSLAIYNSAGALTTEEVTGIVAEFVGW